MAKPKCFDVVNGTTFISSYLLENENKKVVNKKSEINKKDKHNLIMICCRLIGKS